MADEGTVLYRAKAKAPTWTLPLLAFMVLGDGFLLAAGQFFAFALSVPVLATTWLLFSVRRVTVTGRHVHVQYGVIGPKIPLDAIDEVEALPFDIKRPGGWGIHYVRGEWVYGMPGDEGRAVRIVWRDAKGRRKVIVLGNRDPETLAAAIERARVPAPKDSEADSPRSLPSG